MSIKNKFISVEELLFCKCVSRAGSSSLNQYWGKRSVCYGTQGKAKGRLKSLSGDSSDHKGNQSRECFFPANVSAPRSALPGKADAAILSSALGILGVSPDYSCSINNCAVSASCALLTVLNGAAVAGAAEAGH